MEKQTPEQVMRKAFESLAKTRECLEQAGELYELRNSEIKSDSVNATNVREVIDCLAQAYDCISEIWENDLN